MLRGILGESRSKHGTVQSALDVKSWLARPPTVDEVRPGRCPWCGGASRCPGAKLGLWGHGVRDRHVQGPLTPDADPVDVVIAARRYLCQACDAVVVVVPREVVAWRHYTAAAIAWALALGEQRPVAEVRRRTSTTAKPVGFGEPRRWATLRRWVAAAVRGALFDRARLRPPATDSTLRQIAAYVARTLAAHALPSARHGPLAAQAFFGEALMA